MKLQEFLNENGARQTAEKLVDSRIIRITGLSMHDLPDSSELWDIVDEIEEELSEEDYNPNKIKETLQDITLEFIEEICM
jgi:hypothetical protein